MIKTIGKRLGILVLILLVILLGLFLYESSHDFSEQDQMIGKSVDSPNSEYSVSDWSSHLGYLDTFNFEGQKIRYIDRGDRNGTPLLLIHGTPTNSRLRRKMIPGLIDTGYRVIAPDMYGFGTSDKSDVHAELTPQRQSERLLALMEDLEIQKFALAGHDQGSLWVRETITKAPEKISHLIVMNSIGVREGFHPPAGFGSANLATKFSGWAMGSKFLGRIFAYGAMAGGLKNIRHASMDMVNGYLFPLFSGTHKSYYDFITHFDEIEEQLTIRQNTFKSLDIPTTIIRGKHDKILVGEEQIPVLKDLLKVKDKDIHLLDSGAHFIQEEIPEQINEIVVEFVK